MKKVIAFIYLSLFCPQLYLFHVPRFCRFVVDFSGTESYGASFCSVEWGVGGKKRRSYK